MDKEVGRDIITAVVPSIMRRAFGVGVLSCAGFLMLYIVVTQPPEGLQWILVLILAGGMFLYGSYKMWDATGYRIELTDDGIRMSNGIVVARFEDIHAVDRSFFAFKPSNGFLVTLNKKYTNTWVPGLWWRIGKRIGIGGLTSGAEGKIMADTLAAMIAQRDGLIELP
jgi:hypothetical protein